MQEIRKYVYIICMKQSRSHPLDNNNSIFILQLKKALTDGRTAYSESNKVVDLP